MSPIAETAEGQTTAPSRTKDWHLLSADRALPLLLERHGAKIFHLASKLCGNTQDAEDLVQDVFLQAFRKWHQFNGESEPTTWLYTIAARACGRRKRKKSGEPDRVHSLDDLKELSGSPMEGPVLDLPNADDPLSHQLKKEAREGVENALVRLPLHFRMALVLKDVVELTVPQIAEVLGLKPATVKTRIHRARLLIRDHLLHSSPMPRRDAPPPIFSKRVCVDLLTAKQEAIDRGVPFPVPDKEVCVRCESFFRDLDLGRDTCRSLADGELPHDLRKLLLQAFQST